MARTTARNIKAKMLVAIIDNKSDENDFNEDYVLILR